MTPWAAEMRAAEMGAAEMRAVEMRAMKMCSGFHGPGAHATHQLNSFPQH